MDREMLKMRWILLALTLTFPLFSFSGENENKYTQDAQHASNAEKRGTNTDPIAVKILPSPDAETNAAKDEDRREEKAQYDRWLTWATIALAILTALIVVFNASLWVATRRLVKGAEETSGRQANEMQRSLAIAEKQHELQRWQYLITHRPKLIIRRISLDEGDKDGSRSPNIQFNIANIGGSRATIIESNATFAKIDGRLPAIPPYSIDTNTIKCAIREAGQSDPPEILDIEDVEVSHIVSNWRGRTVTNGDSSQFYFFGRIQYRDSIDIVRRMAFCRRYNPTTKRFVEIDDPEYEYAD